MASGPDRRSDRIGAVPQMRKPDNRISFDVEVVETASRTYPSKGEAEPCM